MASWMAMARSQPHHQQARHLFLSLSAEFLDSTKPNRFHSPFDETITSHPSAAAGDVNLPVRFGASGGQDFSELERLEAVITSGSQEPKLRNQSERNAEKTSEKGGPEQGRMALKEELDSVTYGHSGEVRVEFRREEVVRKRVKKSGV
ncbi:hypothetical protein R1sor_012215 [Riccia sorocarpa]|uniref:Uncharacterized protein n=1 Tax=Riccia sorocarpa TaxID=122646 RepID=A0ABD3I4Z9_9MARC